MKFDLKTIFLLLVFFLISKGKASPKTDVKKEVEKPVDKDLQDINDWLNNTVNKGFKAANDILTAEEYERKNDKNI